MRVLWKVLKVIIGLVILIPLGIALLVATLGILGTMLGLAVLALKLAFFALVGYGLFRVARRFFAPASKLAATPPVHELPKPDPYYESAMRELDAEMRS